MLIVHNGTQNISCHNDFEDCMCATIAASTKIKFVSGDNVIHVLPTL